MPDPRLRNAIETARAAYRIRGLRNGLFGQEMFSDPAWDMLLDLFIAAHDGHRLSVSAVCVGARCPPATALRYLNLMSDLGWIYREADADDGRRFYIVLQTATFDRLLDLLDDARADPS